MAGRREGSVEIARFPQGNYIDDLRWLPPIAAFDRLLTAATYDADSETSSIEIHTITQQNSPRLELQTSWTSPARISSLKVAPSAEKAIIAASSRSGHLFFLMADLLNASLEAETSVVGSSLHTGPITGMDLEASTCHCVSVGEDGRVNLVKLAESEVHHTPLFHNGGLFSYTAARWTSPMEFVTAGLGFSLQWWDTRKPGGPVSKSPSNWIRSGIAGIIHSIDVHPSRKHLCVVGGSSGSVFAWDLRSQQEPMPLIDVGPSRGKISGTLSESEVWEVKYDHYTQSASLGAASSKIPPVMMCSEDGILAVFESGEVPLELLAEPCAINTFDIDPENPSDVICGLEWEAILFLKRS